MRLWLQEASFASVRDYISRQMGLVGVPGSPFIRLAKEEEGLGLILKC